MWASAQGGTIVGLVSYLLFSVVLQEAFFCQEDKLPSQELCIVPSPLPQEPFPVSLAAKDEKEGTATSLR